MRIPRATRLFGMFFVWLLASGCTTASDGSPLPLSTPEPVMSLAESQLASDPSYMRSSSGQETIYTKDTITFSVDKDGRIALYISFMGYRPTLNCSIYLPMRPHIQETIELVKNKTYDEHIQAGCNLPK